MREDEFCTDVTAACFRGADLRGVDLSQVKGLTLTQLNQAIVDEQTKLPPGLEVAPVHRRR